MSYREYVPTCVETLFGRPPTKFKARAIIPESKTPNLDSGRCKCSACEKHSSQKKASNLREEFSGNEMRYKCMMNCPDCRKQIKKKGNIVLYEEGAREKRGYINERKNRRPNHSHYECYCIPQYDFTDEEYYPEETTRMKHKAIIKQNYSSEPSRSTDSPDYSDSDRFCCVCQNWVRYDYKEKRDEYSSNRYEDREFIEDRVAPKGPSTREYHLVIERCKFCGNSREGPIEFAKKTDDPCQELQTIAQSQEMCEMAREIDQCSRSEGFFTIKKFEEPLVRSNDKEKDSCDEIYEKFIEEMAALEHHPEAPKDEDLIQENLQEGVLNSKEEPTPSWEIRKAHSASEISTIEKQNKNTNENLEDYKQQLLGELIDKSREKIPQNTDFRSCNCEYARREWKEEPRRQEPDKSEIRLLKQKCEEALGQLELFKREIAMSKLEKCHCDMESTMCVVQDCKLKCAQLEKKVVYLQRTIDFYTRPKAGNTEGKREIRRSNQANEKQRKQELTEHSNYVSTTRKSRKRDQDREVITANVKVLRKPKSTCSPARVRNMGCQHIRCFPRDQIPNIPGFKTCPEYLELDKQRGSKR